MGLVKSHGYSARVYGSGAEFLAAGAGRDSDCLIADMHMPGMTGLELHRQLLDQGAAPPTILVTARHDQSLQDRALSQGMHCYLTKPLNEEQLMRCILAAVDPDPGDSRPAPS